MSSLLRKPVASRSASATSMQQTPNAMQRQDPLDAHEEPPPPYAELDAGTPYQQLNAGTSHQNLHRSASSAAPEFAPIEYSHENSPQLVVGPELEYMDVASRSSNYVASQAPELAPVQPMGSPALGDPSLVPAPLSIRPAASPTQSSLSQTSQPTSPPPQWSQSQTPQATSPPSQASRSQTAQSTSNLSSAKAREAGFDLESPLSPDSASLRSSPSVAILPSTEPLIHTREAGKVTAYLIPFPKPRIKGINPEDIPERFLVYTPILPPLSKPAPGEKETHWHKTSRQWQEDVRKATMSKASAASWKGMKAKTTSLIHKGVNMTRSSNVEFLDRVSGGHIAESTEEVEAEDSAGNPASPPTTPHSPALTSRSSSTSTSLPRDKEKEKAKDTKPSKPPPLQNLTLIYPPSLSLSPEQIRAEFIDTLLRTQETSRKDALISSTLLPFAAALDASLIFTLGGLTQTAGAWAYTSTRGVLTSKKMTKGLARGEEAAAEKQNDASCEPEMQGCTCGHHEVSFGTPSPAPKDNRSSSFFGKEKAAKPGIDMHLQASAHLEILRRYLDIACLKKDYHLFPQIGEASGDIGEGTVLKAIGWTPVRRQGRDLEVEFKDGVKAVSSEEDEGYQLAEAREDVKRYFRKGAGEWVDWCKEFQKGKAKGKDGKEKSKTKEKDDAGK